MLWSKDKILQYPFSTNKTPDFWKHNTLGVEIKGHGKKYPSKEKYSSYQGVSTFWGKKIPNIAGNNL